MSDSKIIVKRDKSYVDRLRSYKIVMDGKLVGTIANGMTVPLNAAPGKHTLYFSIDWCKSNKIDFECNVGDVLEFICRNSINGLRFLFWPLYITFLKNSYLTLTKI